MPTTFRYAASTYRVREIFTNILNIPRMTPLVQSHMSNLLKLCIEQYFIHNPIQHIAKANEIIHALPLTEPLDAETLFTKISRSLIDDLTLSPNTLDYDYTYTLSETMLVVTEVRKIKPVAVNDLTVNDLLQIQDDGGWVSPNIRRRIGHG